MDRVLTPAEALPVDERWMLEDLLRKRRLEAWRRETAAEARKAVRDFCAGRLERQSAEDVSARLRAGLASEAEGGSTG